MKIKRKGKKKAPAKKTTDLQKQKKKGLDVSSLPKRYCDNCVRQESCPFYKSGYECQFQTQEDLINVDEQDIPDIQKDLLKIQLERLYHALAWERINNELDPYVDDIFKEINNLVELIKNKSGISSQSFNFGQIFLNAPARTEPSEEEVIDVDFKKKE